MIVDCGIYRAGVRDDTPFELSADQRWEHTDDGFVWIGLHEPTADEFGAASSEFGFHELLVEDALKAHQRAKSERYDQVDFVVLKAASYRAPDQVAIGELQLVLGTSFVLTIRHGDTRPLSSVRARLEADPELLALGPVAVLYAVADAIVDDYAVVISELELDVAEAEAAVFSDDRLNPAQRIFSLKRQVLELLRNLVPVGEVLDEIQKPGGVLVDEALHPYFRDVEDHLRRALSRLELLRDLLTDALNANLAQVSVRQNEDMRTISAWAAIIAAPTLLAGIWGMNFEHMPEVDTVFGYPFAIATMLVAVGLLWRRFKRSGWI